MTPKKENSLGKRKRLFIQYQIAIVIGYLITQVGTYLLKIFGFSSVSSSQILYIVISTILFTFIITLIFVTVKELSENYIKIAVRVQFVFWLIMYMQWVYFFHEARDFALIFAFMPLMFLIINSGYLQSLLIILTLVIIHLGTSFFAIYFKNQSGSFVKTVLYIAFFLPSGMYISYVAGLFQHYRAQLKKALKDTEKAYDSLWAEMGIAKKIQTVLLPENITIPGYEIVHYMAPTDQVGGDYYDIINSNKNNWIIIGDVAGHGLPAGLIMMMVQSIIRSHLMEKAHVLPSELIKIVNTSIQYNIKKIGANKFMTITAFLFSQNDEILYSGRHEHIIVYNNTLDEVAILKTGGMLISNLPLEKQSEDFNLHINKNDIMILYTDGLTEAWEKGCPEHERMENMFGIEKIKNILFDNRKKSPDEILKCILDELKNYDTDDDVTVLVIKKII